MDFLETVFLFFNLSSPSFETSLQLTNLVNVGCVYAQVIHSLPIVSAPWRLSWDQRRAELSRKTEFKKPVGQFNRAGQINYNVFWLPALGSPQNAQANRRQGTAQGMNGGLGQDGSSAASSSSSLLAAGDEPVV